MGFLSWSLLRSVNARTMGSSSSLNETLADKEHDCMDGLYLRLFASEPSANMFADSKYFLLHV